jgi:hypothetical protein
VKKLLALRWSVALLVVAGLIIAPLATPAAATIMTASAMADMAGGMPGCPDGGHNKVLLQHNERKNCPMMTVCILKSLQGVPFAVTTPVFTQEIAARHVPLSNVLADSLDSPPLARPPRSLV